MRREAGFSLVELAVTVLILGLLLGYAVPAFNAYLTGWNLRSARTTLTAELQLLRQKAISEGRPRRAWFSPSSNIYWFQDPENLAWRSYRLPNRVTIESANFAGFFDNWMLADGRAMRAGSVVLRSSAGERDTVAVDLSGWVGRP